MRMRRWCAVLLILVFGVPRPSGAQQQERCAAAIPANIDAGLLVHDMIALLGKSDTFRAQCDRLARSAHVRVKIDVALNLDARAQTAIHRFMSGAITADVELLFGENYRELLAHEFEHIIEQIEGVDLRQEAVAGRAWVLRGGAFETRRAFAIGVQVRTESDPPRATVYRSRTAVR